MSNDVTDEDCEFWDSQVKLMRFKPNYKRWAKKAYWTFSDAVYLICDCCPYKASDAIYITHESLDFLPYSHGEVSDILMGWYAKLKDETVTEETSVEPLEILELALDKHYFPPPELLSQVKIYHGKAEKKPAPTQIVAEPNYTTPYLELMKQAILENGLSKENQDKHDALKDWFEERLKKIHPGEKVETKAKYMATLVRLPEGQKGKNR